MTVLDIVFIADLILKESYQKIKFLLQLAYLLDA